MNDDISRFAVDPHAVTMRDGGGTFDALTLLPIVWQKGYMVGVAPGTGATIPLGYPKVLRRVMKMVAQEWQSTLVGTWRQDDRVHVDPVVHIADRERAMRLGRQYGQQAIWDCELGVALEVRP